MTMTPEQIASAWALVNAATKGPWHVAGVRVKLDRQDTHAICKYDEDAKRDVNIANVWYDPKTGLGYADARFIIASRELVPQLLTALEAERAKVARLVGTIERSMRALKPFADRVFDDNGDLTVSDTHMLVTVDYCNGKSARQVARAILTEIKETYHE